MNERATKTRRGGRVPQNPAPRPVAVSTEPRPPPAAAPMEPEVVVVEDDHTPKVSGGVNIEIDT